MNKFRFDKMQDGNLVVGVPFKGAQLLQSPLYNKGSAFSLEERAEFALEGLLPSKISTLEQQVERAHKDISRLSNPLNRHIDLVALQNRNETLFYRLLHDHLVEYLPIIYTPTVGLACEKFSHIFRKVRGLWITPEHKGRIKQVLGHAPYSDVRLIVVTDNERILGLGDQGAGGIAIPVGKLALYVAIAGYHPSQVLAISLDVGTDNESLRTDPLYLGYPKPRLRGEAYDELVDEFVKAVAAQFPQAILQWEDFKFKNAFRLWYRYVDQICSFNDDIQGTAAVTLASLQSACRIKNQSLDDQKILVVGAGAAGLGISAALRRYWLHHNKDDEFIWNHLVVVDDKGIVIQGTNEFADQLGLSLPAQFVSKKNWKHDTLVNMVHSYKPEVLIGITGQGGLFTRELITSMCQYQSRPVIFPLSNPNSKAEADPADLELWSQGKAIVATGSPFPNVSQTNNVYAYPGVGLGATISKATKITDAMFFEAARVISEFVSSQDIAKGKVLPSLEQLRELTKHVALAVAKKAFEEGVGMKRDLKDIEDWMWFPRYVQYVPDEAFDHLPKIAKRL